MEVSRIRVHPTMKFTLAAFRSFLFWRQRSLASTTRLNCQRHFFRRRWRNGGTVYLRAMHSVVDWFAYAQSINGKFARSLSLSPDSGVLEDIGQRLPFEEPF
jgi:hypothetical protein